MNKFYLLVFYFCFLFVSFFAYSEEEITVHLDVEQSLLPLYLSEIIADQSFDRQYIQNLEQVLQFDFNHNGMTYTIQKPSKKSDLFDLALDLQEIKAYGAYYIVKVKLFERKLFFKVYSVHHQKAKEIEGIALEGNLSQDRRKIHQIADKIFEFFFDEEGIASTQILYTLRKKNSEGKWLSEVWECDYDGENAKRLTHSAQGYCVTPTYFPSTAGRKTGSFCYVSYQTGQSKIYLSSKREDHHKRLNLLQGNQLMPAISKQRDQIAFISDYTGNPDLFIQDFDPEKGAIGKPYQVFAAKHATQGSPTFSPDGKQIAFVSNKDGSPRIYTMPVPKAGSKIKEIKPTLLTKANRENTAPSWSPDGKKIAYCAKTNGVRQIWIYDLEKNHEYQLTQGHGNKENPSWAPNSLHLIFNSTGNNASELFFIHLNQAKAIKISSGTGEKRFPSWEPKT